MPCRRSIAAVKQKADVNQPEFENIRENIPKIAKSKPTKSVLDQVFMYVVHRPEILFTQKRHKNKDNLY
jgi:hypothetical protein